MNFPWLEKENYEFVMENDGLKIYEDGKKRDFSDATVTEIEMLQADLQLHPQASKALDELGVKLPLQRLEKYTECMYGDKNDTADFRNFKSSDHEYYNCGKRGYCKFEGKLCDKIVTPYGVITPSEIRIMTKVAHELSDKEIAYELHLSTYTVNTHITNLLEKIGTKSRVGIAMFAAKRNLI